MTARLLRPDANGVREAAALLRAGALVAFGTETVYGLGADATDDRAVAAIFAAKGRPRFNPLICHYPDAEAAFAHVEADETARRLAAAFWPGPLSLVLRRRAGCPVSLLAAAGLPTLAVRVPAPVIVGALLRAVGRPIAAPSANRSGAVSPTTAGHVQETLGDGIAAIVDSGPCRVGVESTVLDLTGTRPVLLRPGGATVEAIEAVVGTLGGMTASGDEVRSPGQLASHYAPSVPVRLNAREASGDEAMLAFGPPPEGAGAVYQLSAGENLIEAAGRLFAGLHELDAAARRRGLARIAAMPIPETGLGLAINDRLRRAAAAEGFSGRAAVP